jgi:hypothetical protein
MTAIEGLTALQKRFAAISDSRMMLGQIALLAIKEAKDIAPRKTGNLGRTIRLGTVTDTNAQIMAGGVRGVGYARYVEEGTGLYGPRKRRIVPVKAKVLAWRTGGPSVQRLSGKSRTRGGKQLAGWAFAKSVKGRPATPYLLPGAKKAMSKAGLADRVISAWNEAS